MFPVSLSLSGELSVRFLFKDETQTQAVVSSLLYQFLSLASLKPTDCHYVSDPFPSRKLKEFFEEFRKIILSLSQT